MNKKRAMYRFKEAVLCPDRLTISLIVVQSFHRLGVDIPVCRVNKMFAMINLFVCVSMVGYGALLVELVYLHHWILQHHNLLLMEPKRFPLKLFQFCQKARPFSIYVPSYICIWR